ncbi:uncharacterized protein LOC131614118 [Vicia villosa]|uniref:uncharacterized protein LOC131614118 n=1 Tax=Vicia villosa TaxID=3911 RepID=UPI00273AB05C|nr:uncharacterized protein LOC131614118 [Vicia villosa]
MEVLNVALLSKWKWRILMDKEAVWRDILEERYGNIKLKVLVGDSSVVNKKDSMWWRDLLTSDNYENLLLENFASAIQVKVGNGLSSPFWYADWVGELSLLKIFPSLYSMARNHLQSIFSAGSFLHDNWQWDISSLFAVGSLARTAAERRFGSGSVPYYAVTGEDFLAEQDVDSPHMAVAVDGVNDMQNSLLEFCNAINSKRFIKDEEDSFIWRLNSEGCFSVKSCYVFFKGNLSGPPLNVVKVRALAHLWTIKVPSKILFFCWRFIHNRIATKENLVRRGILNDVGDSLCVLCYSEEETLAHLFSDCEVSKRVWRRVFMWLGVGDFLSMEEFLEFFYNCSKIGCLSKRVIAAVVWLATIWTLWIKHNAIIFRNDSFSFIECMSEIVFVSWSWLNSFYKKLPVM